VALTATAQSAALWIKVLRFIKMEIDEEFKLKIDLFSHSMNCPKKKTKNNYHDKKGIL